MKLSKLSDFEDLITGAKILGCGGGGEESHAIARAKKILEQGLKVKVIDPKDMPDDALLCIAGMVGGRASPEYMEIVKHLPVIDERPVLTATKLLEAFLGEKLHTLISTEIGAGNFLAPIYISAIMGINILDGDLAGRAKPEISISASNVVGISITPLAIVSAFGDKMILKDAPNDQRAESIARQMAVISGGVVGVARCPAHWSDYKKAAIPNTISKSKNLGAEIRRARESGSNPIKPLLQAINGKILFEGKVKSFLAEDEGGFVIGELLLEGKKNEEFKVWFKNEFLITWKEKQRFVTSPDLICIVDQKTGEGLTPWAEDFSKDREVTVVGGPNAPLWRTKRGIEIFGPRHFGFDFDYQPIEELTNNS